MRIGDAVMGALRAMLHVTGSWIALIVVAVFWLPVAVNIVVGLIRRTRKREFEPVADDYQPRHR